MSQPNHEIGSHIACPPWIAMGKPQSEWTRKTNEKCHLAIIALTKDEFPSIHAASQHFNIPFKTLWHWVHGSQTHVECWEELQLLSPAEEKSTTRNGRGNQKAVIVWHQWWVNSTHYIQSTQPTMGSMIFGVTSITQISDGKMHWTCTCKWVLPWSH